MCALGATMDTTKHVGQMTQLADPAHAEVYAHRSALGHAIASEATNAGNPVSVIMAGAVGRQ